MTSSYSRSQATTARAHQPRFVDQLNPTLINLATIFGFGLPIVGYFCFILHYGVNIPYQDGWNDITVIHECSSHLLSCETLWTQHNEDRLLFPILS